jgi:dTDP-4-amino-4,6-dideoxygalactose transaminase
MDPIVAIAERYNLIVIEDACQAHGAEYYSESKKCWLKAGSVGRAAAFSFYPGKNLGACGEAGAVTTNDAEVAERVRMLRDHGQSKKYIHQEPGYNGRLDAIQAGILGVKLKRLPAWTTQRQQAARVYNDLFKPANGVVCTPHEAAWAKHVYHLYVVRVQERERLQNHLAAEGIGTGIHYPIPLHLQKAYEGLGYGVGSFPVAERLAPEILSLPMFPGLDPSDQARVGARILDFACQKV